MAITRRPFQGVLNILSFNRHFYIIGLGLIASLFAANWIFSWPDYLFWILLFATLYGLLMPLIVSAYVYDLSGFYQFNWIPRQLLNRKEPLEIVNINAGFDETSFLVESKFPNSTIQVFDFYDSSRHTEPAIKRARKVSITYPNTREIDTSKIPLNTKTVDIVFLLSAIHEIRSQSEKEVFLKECHRVLKPGGQVVMVEHLRDLPNFLAFTIGFTHFFSRKTWKNAFMTAGFSSFEEKKFTPFMSIFTSSVE
jgi:ubiquinone/menaquinone biosynthesis C-methylase UbiE